MKPDPTRPTIESSGVDTPKRAGAVSAAAPAAPALWCAACETTWEQPRFLPGYIRDHLLYHATFACTPVEVRAYLDSLRVGTA